MIRIALVALAWISICVATGVVGAAEKPIMLLSTTSTENSGLLRDILPQFTAATGIEVAVVARGTGEALRAGERGDGDVLMVHARAAEEAFVAAGHGVKRFDVMYNDFVIAGPPEDPAGVAAATSATDALQRIATARAYFASRGDDSGTHKKELDLWKRAGIDPAGASGTWYRETGSGMGATLNAAVGMEAYVLTDRGTWISFENKLDYVIQFERDSALFNPYGVILVNPERHPSVRAAEGQRLIDWLVGPEGQRAIAAFRIGGQQLFYPYAERAPTP